MNTLDIIGPDKILEKRVRWPRVAHGILLETDNAPWLQIKIVSPLMRQSQQRSSAFLVC